MPKIRHMSYSRYLFFKADTEWRRLSGLEKDRAKAQFAAVLEEHTDRMLINSYNLVGTRGDSDFLLWQISSSITDLSDLASRLRSTWLGQYLETPYSYLAMARPSPYVETHKHSDQTNRPALIEPRGDDYLFVYPFVKTNDWYQLPKESRQQMMNEHFTIGHRYPSVKVHTTYSFGIDDQEFVLGFESNDPEDFLRLVMELRESKARPYTLVDTPIFTCVRSSFNECLDSLG